VKHEQAQAILLRLNDEVWTAVREVEQTAVAALKTEDGLSADDAWAVRDAALQAVKSYLGKPGLAVLERVIQPDELTAYILARIEAAVHDMKQEASE
jgi:hypothetical protein